MKIILLDTETTDVGGHLVQLAYKAYDDAVCCREWCGLFKPPEPIRFGAMAVHHITNEMVADKAVFTEEDRLTVQEMLDDRILVAHNAAFDVEVLKKAGLNPKWVICTFKVAYHLFQDQESHALQYLRYALGLNDAELDKISAHDAMGDVLVLERLFARCLGEMSKEKPIQDCLKEMVEISSKPLLLRKMNFGKHKGMSFVEIHAKHRDCLVWIVRTFDTDEERDDNVDLVYTAKHYLSLAH